MFAFRAVVGDGPFFYPGHRLTGAPVKHVDLPGFGGLDQDRNLFAPLIFHMEQHRLRRQVVIPDIMMHGLEDPLRLAGAGVHRHHGRTVFLFGRVAIAAPVVRRTVTGRQINQVQLFIKARHRPDVRRFKGVDAAFYRVGNVFWLADVPRPHHVSVSYVKRPYHAGRFAVHDIAHPAAENRNMPHNHRRRGRVVSLAVFGIVHPLLQIDATVIAEVVARFAGFGVQGDQPRVDGRHQDTLWALQQRRAGLLFRAQRIIALYIVIANAAAGDVFGGTCVRVKTPARFTGIRIQRGDNVQRRTGVERVANL